MPAPPQAHPQPRLVSSLQACQGITEDLCTAAGLVVDRASFRLIAAGACEPVCDSTGALGCVAQREASDQVVNVAQGEGAAASAGVVAAVASTCAVALLLLLLIVVLAYRCAMVRWRKPAVRLRRACRRQASRTPLLRTGMHDICRICA